MLAKRIIPCLDVDNGRVVKGINFVKLKDAGDPVALAKFYYQQGADELVFLDITASVGNRKTMIDVIKELIAIPCVFINETNDSKCNILHMAARYKRSDFFSSLGSLRDLSEYEKLLNGKEQKFGETPLHFCVRYGNWETTGSYIELLIRSKQDLFLKNKKSETAIDLAKRLAENSFDKFLKSTNDFEISMFLKEMKEFQNIESHLLTIFQTLKKSKPKSRNRSASSIIISNVKKIIK